MAHGYERAQLWAWEAGIDLHPDVVDLSWRMVGQEEGSADWRGGIPPLRELPPEEAEEVADRVIRHLISMMLDSRATPGQQSERFIEAAARFVVEYPEFRVVVEAPGLTRTAANHNRAKAVLHRVQEIQASRPIGHRRDLEDL